MIKNLYKKIVPLKVRNSIRILSKKVLTPFYLGDQIECNCCGKSFHKMLTKAGRQNAECPNCGSLERTRLLLFYFQNETEVFKKRLKVLHFAPEPSLFKHLKNQNLDYIDGDIDPNNASYIVDITNIQFPDNHFDLIICSHVLAHVPNEAKAIDEIYRVLSPTGKAIILTYINPNSESTIDHDWVNTDELRKEHYGEPDCLRLHGQDFKNRLAKSGLSVKQIDYRSELGEAISVKNVLGEGPREWIFECTKSH